MSFSVDKPNEIKRKEKEVEVRTSATADAENNSIFENQEINDNEDISLTNDNSIETDNVEENQEIITAAEEGIINLVKTSFPNKENWTDEEVVEAVAINVLENIVQRNNQMLNSPDSYGWTGSLRNSIMETFGIDVSYEDIQKILNVQNQGIDILKKALNNELTQEDVYKYSKEKLTTDPNYALIADAMDYIPYDIVTQWASTGIPDNINVQMTCWTVNGFEQYSIGRSLPSTKPYIIGITIYNEDNTLYEQGNVACSTEGYSYDENYMPQLNQNDILPKFEFSEEEAVTPVDFKTAYKITQGNEYDEEVVYNFVESAQAMEYISEVSNNINVFNTKIQQASSMGELVDVFIEYYGDEDIALQQLNIYLNDSIHPSREDFDSDEDYNEACSLIGDNLSLGYGNNITEFKVVKDDNGQYAVHRAYQNGETFEDDTTLNNPFNAMPRIFNSNYFYKKFDNYLRNTTGFGMTEYANEYQESYLKLSLPAKETERLIGKYDTGEQNAVNVVAGIGTTAAVVIALALAAETGGTSLALLGSVGTGATTMSFGSTVTLAATVGGTTNTLIRGSNTISAGKEYSFTDGVRDFTAGGIQGATIPISAGIFKYINNGVKFTSAYLLAEGRASSTFVNYLINNPLTPSGIRILAGTTAGMTAGEFSGTVNSAAYYTLYTDNFSFDGLYNAASNGFKRGRDIGAVIGFVGATFNEIKNYTPNTSPATVKKADYVLSDSEYSISDPIDDTAGYLEYTEHLEASNNPLLLESGETSSNLPAPTSNVGGNITPTAPQSGILDAVKELFKRTNPNGPAPLYYYGQPIADPLYDSSFGNDIPADSPLSSDSFSVGNSQNSPGFGSNPKNETPFYQQQEAPQTQESPQTAYAEPVKNPFEFRFETTSDKQLSVPNNPFEQAAQGQAPSAELPQVAGQETTGGTSTVPNTVQSPVNTSGITISEEILGQTAGAAAGQTKQEENADITSDEQTKREEAIKFIQEIFSEEEIEEFQQDEEEFEETIQHILAFTEEQKQIVRDLEQSGIHGISLGIAEKFGENPEIIEYIKNIPEETMEKSEDFFYDLLEMDTLEQIQQYVELVNDVEGKNINKTIVKWAKLDAETFRKRKEIYDKGVPVNSINDVLILSENFPERANELFEMLDNGLECEHIYQYCGLSRTMNNDYSLAEKRLKIFKELFDAGLSQDYLHQYAYDIPRLYDDDEYNKLKNIINSPVFQHSLKINQKNTTRCLSMIYSSYLNNEDMYEKVIGLFNNPQILNNIENPNLQDLFFANFSNEGQYINFVSKVSSMSENEIDALIGMGNYMSSDFIRNLLNNDVNILELYNSDAFANNKELISKINNSTLKNNVKNELTLRLLNINNSDYSNMNLRQRIDILKILQETKTNNFFTEEDKNALNIDDEIAELQKSIRGVIYCTDISQEEAMFMVQRYLESYNGLQDLCNADVFAENKELILKVNNSNLSTDAKRELTLRLLNLHNTDYTQMNLKEKMKKLEILQEAQTCDIFAEEEKNFLHIDAAISELQDALHHIISPTEVSQEAVINMMKGFFANNNPELETLLSTTDFSQYGKEGLPLTYSRKEFLEDIKTALENCTDEEKNEIVSKLGLIIYTDKDGNYSAYEGIIDLTKLSTEGAEGEVLKLATHFIKENSISTGNEELDNALNSLIQGMPEFINIIGKQQHETQDFSLDIHILTVLKEAMANPKYQELSNEDKTCLKFAIILHDIAKQEGIVDNGHADFCALYAKDILDKSAINLPKEMKDRIYELIKNHHWLADYNNNKKNAAETAALFRRNGDYEAALIFAEADLKGVKAGGFFYKLYGSALGEEKQAPIAEELKKINATGQMFLTGKVIMPDKLPTTEINGKTYKVINFTEMDDDTDLSQYGFAPGTTKKNLRLFIHTVRNDNIKNLENVYNLSDPAYQGFLCVSYVSIDNHPTYYDNKFGVSLEAENANIANAASKNQASGTEKNFLKFIKFITDKSSVDKFRSMVPNSIKETLSLTDSEYAQLYENIKQLKYISQLESISEIEIGGKTFTGSQILDAIRQADDKMMNEDPTRHNEANLYDPKTNAVIAKVNSIEEVPQELLDFAHKHNLPIYILGE